MRDFAAAHNELVDSHNEADDALMAIKAKIADLEDRSNNMKFCGVAENILPAELPNHIQQLIAMLLTEVPK